MSSQRDYSHSPRERTQNQAEEAEELESPDRPINAIHFASELLSHALAAKSGASFAPCFWCIKPVTGFDFEQKTSLLQYIWALL
jgi:hypothetical protein